ncbi:hypothetical protein NW752_001986 [Fusarium irregulare]|uniref:Uncharacterized protein n=1 Tax=Fusarium irregulare TaxID=2494466 RepID=A0A9W8PWP2_9HYPO|nr:hypothetical protein NW766_004149 [Fusarium irregulare]KAJ4027026.1 hypothetical protein NW752_001986 [Fusarium irregulare]
MQTRQSSRIAKRQEDAAATIVPQDTPKPSGKKGRAVKTSPAQVPQFEEGGEEGVRSEGAVPSPDELPQSEESQHQSDAEPFRGKKRSSGGAVKPSTTPALRSEGGGDKNARSVWEVPSSPELPQSEESDAKGTWSTRTRQAARTLATPSSSKRVPGRGMTATDDEEEEEKKEEDDGEYEDEDDEGGYEDDEGGYEDDEEFEGDNEEDLLLDDVESPPDEQDGDGEEEDDDDDESEPRKRTRLSEYDSCENAEEWIRMYNQKNPVDEDDQDKHRFQTKIRAMITLLCRWARDETDTRIEVWMRLSATDREMTRPFRGLLAHQDSTILADNLLAHIPDKAQKVLGKRDLKAIDLLDLPEVPGKFRHRITYVNVSVKVGVRNVVKSQSQLTPKDCQVKTLKPGTHIKSTMIVKTYIGSSINKLGGYSRLRQHEKNATPSC